MTQPQYQTLLAFARSLLDNHPDLTLEPGDLIAEAYLKHGEDGGKMRGFMVGYSRSTRSHPRRWLGYIPNTKKYPVETSQTCKCCQRELPFEDFAKVEDGLTIFYRQTCKQCVNKQNTLQKKKQVHAAVHGQFRRVFDPPPTRRTCRVCDVEKPIEAFPRIYDGMRIGFRFVCHVCYNQQTKASKALLAQRRRNQPPPTDADQ